MNEEQSCTLRSKLNYPTETQPTSSHFDPSQLLTTHADEIINDMDILAL
jgi:hypothetical protein